MKRIGVWFFFGFLFFVGNIISFNQTMGAERKGEYLLPGDIKEGWKVFTLKKCSACHSIWGEGGKGGLISAPFQNLTSANPNWLP